MFLLQQSSLCKLKMCNAKKVLLECSQNEECTTKNTSILQISEPAAECATLYMMTTDSD